MSAAPSARPQTPTLDAQTAAALIDRLVTDLATARGVPESVIWLGLTGQPEPDTNSNPVRVEKSREKVAPDAYRAK